VEALEELVGRALGDFPLRHARQHHAVGRLVGALRVVRVDVHPTVAGAGVVLAEVEERRTAEAGGEFPIGPPPRFAVVFRPGELRVAGIARPQVEHALDAEHATGLFRPGPVAGLLAGRGRDVDALEARWVALDAGETESQLPRHEGLETPAVAVGRVLVAVVGPGERPVVAAFGLADDRFLGRPGEAGDYLARRVGGGAGLLRTAGDRVDDRLEEDLHALVVKGFKHVPGVLRFRREGFAVADDDEVEARDNDQELIAGPGAVVGV